MNRKLYDREYDEKRKYTRKLYDKIHHTFYRDRYLENSKKYYIEHQEEELEKSRQWRLENPNYQHEWYLKNYDKRRAQIKEYESRPEIKKHRNQLKRRSRLRKKIFNMFKNKTINIT